MRIVYVGHHKLHVPESWASFIYHGYRYRLVGRIVERWSPTLGAWRESVHLTTSAPKGRKPSPHLTAGVV